MIAIGLALGVFQNSVTRGIISAVRRADRTVMLQTDAAINPGNSGGPLLNRQGQVVGINTLKVGGAAESLGFAVAADHARALLAGGKATEPFAASAQQSQQLAPAFGARSSTDIAREEGTKRYGQIVEAVARQAVQLDTYWNRIKANCTVRVAPGHDREWFGLWDGRAKLDYARPVVRLSGARARRDGRAGARGDGDCPGRRAARVGAARPAARHPPPLPHGLARVRSGDRSRQSKSTVSQSQLRLRETATDDCRL